LKRQAESQQVTEKAGLSDWNEKILPLREQAAVKNKWLEERINMILPEIMHREKIDMWIISAREENEDPVLLSFLPAPMNRARRRTILVFFKRADGTIERLCLSRPGTGLDQLYRGVWTNQKGSSWKQFKQLMPGDVSPEEDSENPPETQWECLARVVRERDPQSIGINCSDEIVFADGLTHTEYEHLVNSLDPEFRSRLVSAERLTLGWLEKRSKEEIAAYSGIMQIAHSIIAEAFSSRVIHPGITTNTDVVWWMTQKVNDLGLEFWYPYEISIFREGCERVGNDEVILPGDILHCDFGLKYLGLSTDTQENAYVLKLGEEEAPAGIQAIQSLGNRVEDILAEEFVEGRSGNEILQASLERTRQEGINALIYTHPLGLHVHGAGPMIGMCDMQDGVPGLPGEYPLHNDTCYAMELNVTAPVPEWNNQEIVLGFETDIAFTENEVYYLGGRQTKLHLIK